MTRYFLSGFLAVIPAMFLMAQEISLPDIQGYKRISSYPVYTPDNLWDFINGAADTYLAYGFEDLQVAEYKKGKNIIKLEVYKHKNPVQAFGIYSSERSSTFRFINIGAQGYTSEGILNFCKGRYYIKLRTNSKSDKVIRSLQDLGMRVADIIPGQADLPQTLKEFPGTGLIKNEESFINEGVLGHEFLQGAFKAIYETGGINFSIFIIDKTDPAATRKVVADYLIKTGLEIDDSSEGKYIIKDGYNGDIFLSWKDRRIVIISGLSKDQAALADRYTSEILK